MKVYTEEQAIKEAGTAFLEPQEVQDVAAEVARQCTGIVARCLISGDFADLKATMKRYEKEAREKKALTAWITAAGAIYDPHRRKWIVLHDAYADELA